MKEKPHPITLLKFSLKMLILIFASLPKKQSRANIQSSRDTKPRYIQSTGVKIWYLRLQQLKT